MCVLIYIDVCTHVHVSNYLQNSAHIDVYIHTYIQLHQNHYHKLNFNSKLFSTCVHGEVSLLNRQIDRLCN